jgi:esterase/lipase superfamily enzyme
MMPTPDLYIGSEAKPLFAQVAERRSPTIDLLYFTNRAPVVDSKPGLPYGSERSNSVAFGSARVDLGSGIDWDEVVAASKTADRGQSINLSLADTTERGHYPPTPYVLQYTGSGFIRDPAVTASHREAEEDLKREIARRLASAHKKEIVFYVHGVNETFADAAFTTAELCHFLGREHLCAFFTWPAGSGGGLLHSYGQDRESGEFSVVHLKRVIRSMVTLPGIEKVHLLAHSRGADVLIQALRELTIETYVYGGSPRDSLKIENLVLMAADIDAQVVLRHLTLYGSDPEMPSHWQGDQLPPPFRGRMTLYTSGSDRALLASALLFRSQRRVGSIGADDLSPHMKDFLREGDFIDIIEAPRKRIDFLGHGYFTNHPAVSSDLIALIRYGLRPGDAGRPLRQVKAPFVWAIDAKRDDRR